MALVLPYQGFFMRVKIMIDMRNADCLDYLKTLPDNSIDAVVTDPPYLYLGHELDAKFDERLLFSECYRILKPNSLLVFFYCN